MISPSLLQSRVESFIWEPMDEDQPFWRRVLVTSLRISWVVIRDLLAGSLNLRAMSLVYTTLLSIVPALAIGFAIARAFGFDSYIESMLSDFLSPLGDQGAEVTQRMMEFVQRVNANVLGTVGFAFLIYTVVSMIKKVEEAFNAIWHVEASRSITQQFTELVSMGLLGPIVAFTFAGIAAGALSNSMVGSVVEWGPVRFIVEQGTRALPYIVLIGAFTFIYALIPNTRVRLSSAFAGAAIAGITWGAVGWGFATFVVKSAQTVAIYSAFASLVVFMFWLYAAWLILLGGCAISFYFQNRRHLSPVAGIGYLNSSQLERMSVQALLLIHESFSKGHTPWTEETLSRRLHLPMEAVGQISRALRKAGLLNLTGDSPARFVPGKPGDRTSVTDVLAAVRHRKAAEQAIQSSSFAREPRVETLFARLAEREEEITDDVTIQTLIDRDGDPQETANPAKPRAVSGD
ncbi:membrane protein [Parvibaculum indicum]|uniref:YhjD/YihY/BrkB family envelope integrity protein n=1 Tax=Parvibaculum indicum TaxID=562969 RepID=UPI001422D6A8|nr:YhjD/YihY/BrkB family envelope integrity protein [Parvibaculum indicum]NIJ41911.1 membrane protein [Parvibaculum indicum]